MSIWTKNVQKRRWTIFRWFTSCASLKEFWRILVHYFLGSKCPIVPTLKTFSWRFSEVLLDFIAFAYGIRSLTMTCTNTWKCLLLLVRLLSSMHEYSKKHLTHLGCMCENSHKVNTLQCWEVGTLRRMTALSHSTTLDNCVNFYGLITFRKMEKYGYPQKLDLKR